MAGDFNKINMPFYLFFSFPWPRGKTRFSALTFHFTWKLERQQTSDMTVTDDYY